MKMSLTRRIFLHLAAFLLVFMIVQLCLYAWIEYLGWMNHPAEPLRDELNEVLDALILNVVLLPAMLWLSWKVAVRMLAPVRSIADTAKRIGNGNLGERIRAEDMADGEMHSLACTINEAFDGYSSAVNRLKRFVGDASHQLRTPLTAMRTMGEVAIGRDRSADDYRETIAGMLHELDRLRAVIEQLLSLSRLDSGCFRGSFRRVAASDVVERVTRSYCAICEDRGISLVHDAVPDFHIMGVAELLSEMLGNLLDNAIRHTPVGGTVRVGCLTSGDSAVFFVHDTGPGIPEEIAVHLFERFFRVPGSPVGGAGLGLSIARDIALVHGGTLSLANPGCEGARFEAIMHLLRD